MIIPEQRVMKKNFGLILLLTVGVLALACISFFMFTAKLSSPTKMELYMPKDSEDSVDQYSDAKKKLTLILLKNEKVFGYYGDFIKGGQSVSLDETSKLIVDGWKMFSKDSLVVVIKPTEDASYKATVEILDKMATNEIEKYSMNDLNKQEKEFLKFDE